MLGSQLEQAATSPLKAVMWFWWAGDPAGVLVAQKLAKATMANIKQNLIWAFGYNVVLIPVAAGVMVPFGFGMLNPMLAVPPWRFRQSAW